MQNLPGGRFNALCPLRLLIFSGTAKSHFRALDNDKPVIGALQGPIGPPQPGMSVDSSPSAPASPYTAQRSTIRDLTLPTEPNFDIPPSPPESPNPGTDRKFAHFLDLKRQGIHFNAKLASSSALRNPSLLPKLMQSAAVDGPKQYATTLSVDLWDPTGFPDWAYKEELAISQKQVSTKKDEERMKIQRESIDFVSASNSTQTSKGPPGPLNTAKGLRVSAAERVMAGLEGKAVEGRSRSPKRRKRSQSR